MTTTVLDHFKRNLRRGVHPVRMCEIYRMTPTQLQRTICLVAGAPTPTVKVQGSVSGWRVLFERRGGMGL